MNKHSLLILFIFFIVSAIFFHPVFKGNIPFPGDLLVGEINPFKTISLNGYAPGGVPHKAQGSDVIRELYPWKHFVIEMLKKGQPALWNPYNFSGNPLMANFQSGNFYPLNIIFLLLPFNFAWTIYIFLIPLLASGFTYLYLRSIKLSKFSSVFGGIVFAFSSYMVVWLEYGNIGHTFLWLPLALLLTERIINKYKSEYLFSLTAILFVAILAGYIQGYFYTMFVVLVYFITKSILIKRYSVAKTLVFTTLLVLPLFFSAFQILPTLELLQHSSRGNYSLTEIQKLLNPLWYAVTIIAPDFFGNPASRNQWFDGTYIERVSYFGITPFILALSALFQYKKRRETIIFGLIFIISFILAFDLLFTKYFYLIPIPVISTTVPTRVLSLFVFSGAVMAGFGLHALLDNRNRKQLYFAQGLVFLLLTTAWVYAVFSNQTISQRNLIIPSILFLFFFIFTFIYFLNNRLKTFLQLVVILITFFELFYFFHKITPFAPSEYVYPQAPVISFIKSKAGIDRYWGYANAHIETNVQLIDRTYIPDGHDALHIKSYGEFLSTTKNGKIPSKLSRSDSEIVDGYGDEDLTNNYYRQKMLNMLGVKYLLLKNHYNNPESYKLTHEEDDWKIYENLNAAPRFFLTTNYKIAKDKKEIINIFYDKDFNETNTIILEEDPQITRTKLSLKHAKLILYEPNRVKISTSSDSETLLFLSDTFYPGWKARIDSNETKIYRANYAFRAVKIPSGDHTIEFTYEPDSFRTGLIISLFSIIGFILFILYFTKTKKKLL